MVPKSAEYQFGVIYNIYLLKTMFSSLSFAQMTKLLDLGTALTRLYMRI